MLHNEIVMEESSDGVRIYTGSLQIFIWRQSLQKAQRTQVQMNGAGNGIQERVSGCHIRQIWWILASHASPQVPDVFKLFFQNC